MVSAPIFDTLANSPMRIGYLLSVLIFSAWLVRVLLDVPRKIEPLMAPVPRARFVGLFPCELVKHAQFLLSSGNSTIIEPIQIGVARRRGHFFVHIAPMVFRLELQIFVNNGLLGRNQRFDFGCASVDLQ